MAIYHLPNDGSADDSRALFGYGNDVENELDSGACFRRISHHSLEQNRQTILNHLTDHLSLSVNLLCYLLLYAVDVIKSLTKCLMFQKILFFS